MAAIKIRDLYLGEGKPKICIPLMGTDTEALLEEAAFLKTIPCDFAELRADYFAALREPPTLMAALKAVRQSLGNIPLLFTIRTRREGGMADLPVSEYISCIRTAMESGQIDLADAELSCGDEAMTLLAEEAHRTGVVLVGSRHDFEKTPSREEILSALCRMRELGAGIVKFAVMPRSPRDVLTLLDATLSMREQHPETPVITMSMGKMGAVSRVSGSLFGSCVTFGTARQASAPGQIAAESLAEILEILNVNAADSQGNAE